MRGVKGSSTPLYAPCRRPGCTTQRLCTRPSEQRRPTYCSTRCAGLARRGISFQKPRPPLYAECRRPGCEKLRLCRRPYEQRRPGFCSKSCASLFHCNVLKGMTKGVANSVAARKRRRLQQLEQLDAMTPREAFLKGWRAGLNSKLTQIRKRYTLVPKATAA